MTAAVKKSPAHWLRYYADAGQMSCTFGKYVRYRAASRVSNAQAATSGDACIEGEEPATE